MCICVFVISFEGKVVETWTLSGPVILMGIKPVLRWQNLILALLLKVQVKAEI